MLMLVQFNMSGALYISSHLKAHNIKTPIAYVGSHVQALPTKITKR